MIPDIDIEKIEFFAPNEDELVLISEREKKLSQKRLFTRLIISAVIFMLMAVFELLGRYADDRFDTAPNVIIAFIFIFLIFNALSFVHHITMKRLKDLTENYQVLHATVTGKMNNKNYVFFTCADGNCTSGIFVPDSKLFKSLGDGDDIKILRKTKYGTEKYTLIKSE